MTGAILIAFAAGGFWGIAPHRYHFRFPSVEICERERPRVEADMRAHGQVVRFTECRPVSEIST